jgi:hypothetical protein
VSLTSLRNVGFNDACFVSYVSLNVIQPNEVPQDHLWQKIFVIILDLNTAKILVNKNAHAKPR